MAQVAIKPIILNDITLLIGADNYEAAVSRVVLTPTVPQAKWKGMTPAAIFNLAGTPEWVCEVTWAQDHETANSLSQYSIANAGQVKAVEFKPKKPVSPATAPTFKCDVLILPGAIGGDLDTVPTASASWPVNGQPVRTVAA